ncbi:MAG: lysylphosphatidylglycerol synthase transmembrane domain-containing protein [Bacteroidota bacterium]|nr:lysylphosphatidylglycerol synthase transmembrane domain-containing protein [Bacteroidota bacterium]MDP4234590.1 lysylphosphatidylglycerol synthase transmembrane domain-containing protein [Bacteroidota bacterium]MDP4243719.1 lysylphosphatidylglycerol synthase transmembrane domain-containing protein [Bacteroidota bacterium]MDP4288333.1 lysylphosphatidylglycerol synthase transmembrane domain-containing protein [Bacteroidota bacterium]
MKHPLIRLFITILITGGALYLAFRGVHLSALLDELARTNILLILVGVALLFCSHVFRAWRWTVIARPMKPGTSILIAFKAIMGAYAMNNVIPRSGELVRPYIFAKHEKVFMSGTIATILIERVVDLIANVLVMMLALVVFPREITNAFPSLAGETLPIMAGMVLLMALVITMIFSAGKTERVIHRIIRNWPAKLEGPIGRAATEFASGLRGVRASGAVPVVIGTVGIWIFYVLSMYAWLFAFPEPQIMAVGIVGAFFLRVVSGIAFLVPTPGGVGSYHYLISQALFRIFSVPLAAAITYATLTHAAFDILTTVTGLIIVMTEGISFRNFKEVVRASEDHSPQELATALKQPIAEVGGLGLGEH